MIKKIKKQFEKDLAKKARNNPKELWRYINSKSKVKSGIGNLHTDPVNYKSEETDEDSKKADLFAKYFNSVFIEEPDGDIPTLPPRELLHDMPELKATPEGVKKKSEQLQD